MNSEPKSRESELLDSSFSTLKEIQDVPLNQIAKELLRIKKREKKYFI